MSSIVRRGGDENPFDLAEARGSGDPSLVREAEEKVLSLYRLQLRPRFESDPNVLESLPASKDPVECKHWVLSALQDVVRPGTEELFDRAVQELLEELREFRKAPPSLYLIDKDGRAVMPVDGSSTFRPPDFVDEGGTVRKSQLVVHPKITSGIAMSAQASFRRGAALERAKKAGPLGTLALEHELDPSSIARVAREYLERAGRTVGACGSGEWTVLEFGRESLDESSQSVNHAFHRFRLFGEVLGRKVAEMSQAGWTCEIGAVTPNRTAKQRWYTVEVRTSNV
jgi:hypothetical protein